MKFSDFLGKAEGFLRNKKNYIIRKSDAHFRDVERWYLEDPRGLKRSEFPFLTSESVVFDLGGYLGEWSSNLYSRYRCNVHVFEPVKEYADVIRHRFAMNRDIRIVQAGLASADLHTRITLDEYASKIVDGEETALKTEPIELINFSRYLAEHQITNIDLIKLNIEGAEYDLLEHLIKTGLMNKIDTLLIQFHNWEINAANRRDQIRKDLSTQFNEVFNYPFVWECWRKRS